MQSFIFIVGVLVAQVGSSPASTEPIRDATDGRQQPSTVASEVDGGMTEQQPQGEPFTLPGLVIEGRDPVNYSPTQQQPRLSQEQANDAAIHWLRRSDDEFAKVTRIPNDFPDENWWPEIVRAYIDAGNGNGALEFMTRWHMKFGQSCGREMLRLAATRLSERGRFEEAKQFGLLLVKQNNPMLIGFSPDQNEQLCVEALAVIAGRQAAAGDFAGAEATANLIPRKRRTDARADAYFQIALAHARAGDAAGVLRQAAEFRLNRSYDNHDTNLLFAVELAVAGAVDEARTVRRDAARQCTPHCAGPNRLVAGGGGKLEGSHRDGNVDIRNERETTGFAANCRRQSLDGRPRRRP